MEFKLFETCIFYDTATICAEQKHVFLLFFPHIRLEQLDTINSKLIHLWNKAWTSNKCHFNDSCYCLQLFYWLDEHAALAQWWTLVPHVMMLSLKQLFCCNHDVFLHHILRGLIEDEDCWRNIQIMCLIIQCNLLSVWKTELRCQRHGVLARLHQNCHWPVRQHHLCLQNWRGLVMSFGRSHLIN